MSRGRWLLLLVGTALVARLAWGAALASRRPRFDEEYYIAHAITLAEGKGYRDERGQLTAFWPVGYPAVLPGAYRITGPRPLTGMLLQVMLGIATCVLVSRVGGAVFGARVGRPAAAVRLGRDRPGVSEPDDR